MKQKLIFHPYRVLSYISKSHFESLVQNYFDYTRPKYFFNSVQWQTSEQTKDQEDIALEIDLDTDANNDLRYENADLKVSSFSESKAVLDLIIDEGEASENVKELGYCQTSDRLLNDYCNIKNNFVIVPSGSVSAKLRVRVTPFEGALGGKNTLVLCNRNNFELGSQSEILKYKTRPF